MSLLSELVSRRDCVLLFSLKVTLSEWPSCHCHSKYLRKSQWIKFHFRQRTVEVIESRMLGCTNKHCCSGIVQNKC